MAFIDEPHNRARAREAAEAAMNMVCHGAVDRTAEATAAFLHEFAIVAMTRMGDRDANYARQEDPLSSAPLARLVRRAERVNATIHIHPPDGSTGGRWVVEYHTVARDVRREGLDLDQAISKVLDTTPGDRS